MSRIGKKPVAVPAGVTINVSADNVLEVKGPKGTLFQAIHKDIKVEVAEGEITFARPSDEREHRAMHGLYRALVANMVEGVSAGYKKTLELVGVGYKAAANNNVLELELGYSHKILFQVPAELKVTAEQEKGKNPMVHVEGSDKQLLGQVCAKIRSLRKPEPYKGKGVKFTDEVIRRKAGKSAGKKK